MQQKESSIYAGSGVSQTPNIYYTGKEGNSAAFAHEMETSGVADSIRAEEGNLRYEYFVPMNGEETVLLIDSWRDQAALDMHHTSPMMQQIIELRNKYDLHMKVERYLSDDTMPAQDREFVRE